MEGVSSTLVLSANKQASQSHLILIHKEKPQMYTSLCFRMLNPYYLLFIAGSGELFVSVSNDQRDGSGRDLTKGVSGQLHSFLSQWAGSTASHPRGRASVSSWPKRGAPARGFIWE